MKIIYIFFTFMLLSCTESIISINSARVKDEGLKDYNVYAYYSLPKTILEVRIPISKDTLKQGLVKDEESCFGKILKVDFGWTPTKQPDDNFSLDKKITFKAVTLPDPDKRYAIAYKKAKTISQTLNVTLSKDGLIQSGEFAQESKAFNVAKKSIELAGTLIGSVAGLGRNGEEGFKVRVDKCHDQRTINLISNARTLLAARLGLVSSPTNSVNTVDVVKHHLGEIDKQLKAIKDELVGKVTKKIHYVTIYVDPRKDFKDIELLTLNSKYGVVTKDKNSALKVLSDDLVADEKSESKLKEQNGGKIRKLELTARKLIEPGTIREPVTEIETDKDGNKELKTNVFLYYNLPAKYELKLLYGGKPVQYFNNKKEKEGSDDYKIYFPQLGKVTYLPKDFKEANVVYYEDTGGLKSAKFVKAAEMDANNLESFYNAIDSVRKTIKAINKASEKEPVVEEEVTEEVDEQVIRLIIQEDSDK